LAARLGKPSTYSKAKSFQLERLVAAGAGRGRSCLRPAAHDECATRDGASVPARQCYPQRAHTAALAGVYPAAKPKDKAMNKTTEALISKQTETNLSITRGNPWLEAAAEADNDTGKLLKFVKGKWETGDDAVPEGTEFVAHIDQLVRDWIKFDDGKVVDRIIGKIADGFIPPQRKDLSDNDPADWREKDADGRPRDPWVAQWFLPLIGVESGDVVTFVTGSKGGIAAVADLCRIYGHGKRNGLLPIVALKTSSYKHKQYGRIETPGLSIVGWDGVPAAEATTIPVQPEKAAAAENTDFEDEIPY
jgi:hypothetical protein